MPSMGTSHWAASGCWVLRVPPGNVAPNVSCQGPWPCPHACPSGAQPPQLPCVWNTPASHAPHQPQSWRPHGAAGVSRRLWGAGLTSHLLRSLRTRWGQLRGQDLRDSSPSSLPSCGNDLSGCWGSPRAPTAPRVAPRLLSHIGDSWLQMGPWDRAVRLEE